MKRLQELAEGCGLRVASHAEAWIETTWLRQMIAQERVASHAEAWIETKDGLAQSVAAYVASHAEAWIETPPRCSRSPLR